MQPTHEQNIDTIPSEIMTPLARYRWPGNVRELQNVIERAVIVSTGAVLNPSMEEPQLSVNGPPVISHGSGNLRATLEETERQEIVAALERRGGEGCWPQRSRSPARSEPVYASVSHAEARHQRFAHGYVYMTLAKSIWSSRSGDIHFPGETFTSTEDGD
jgi:hypothetical protein